MPHEWTTKGKATEAAGMLCSIAKDNEGKVPPELIPAYADMLRTARPAITAAFFERLNKGRPELMAYFIGAADWEHEAKHEMALNEVVEIQQQISQLWESVEGLRKDVDRWDSTFRFVQQLAILPNGVSKAGKNYGQN
jgi:hypothetical protein